MINVTKRALASLACAAAAFAADYKPADMFPEDELPSKLCVLDARTGMPYAGYPLVSKIILTAQGIHYHHFGDPNRPLGRVEPAANVTDSTGCFKQSYFSPDLDHRVNIVVTSPELPGDIAVIDVRVFVPGIVNVADQPIPVGQDGLPDYSLPTPNQHHWGLDRGVAPGVDARLKSIMKAMHEFTGKTQEITRLGSMLGGNNDDGWIPWVADYGDKHMKGLGFDVNIRDEDAAFLGYTASGNGCLAAQKPSGVYHIGCSEGTTSVIIF